MERGQTKRAFAIGLFGSMLLHGSLVWVLVSHPSPARNGVPLDVPVWSDFEVDVEVRASHEAGDHLSALSSVRAEPAVVPVLPGGPESAQNIDSRRDGGGGDGIGPSQVLLLTDRAHPITLSDTTPNTRAISQTNRIQTDEDRATQEDRRATPNPHDQPFVASGTGDLQERREDSRDWPSEGAERAQTTTSLGGVPRRASPNGPIPASPDARVAPGESQTAPGAGVLDANGRRPSQRAPIAFGRPLVDDGPAATPAEQFAGPVRDRRNAEQLAAALTQSWVAASERSAPTEGEGAGGLSAPGEEGSGRGVGTGTAQPHRPGPGGHAALDTSSARYRMWHRAMRRQVEGYLSFPRARAIAMDQGVSVYRFRVRQDGTLVSVPEVNRSSTFVDLDQAGQHAIRQAAPFPPLPEDLGPHHTVSLRIEHRNPMVR